MRSNGLVPPTVEQQQQQQQPVALAATVATAPPAEEGVDSVGPSLCMPNGKPISPSALPPGPSRAALQKAILTQDTERSEIKELKSWLKQSKVSRTWTGLKVMWILFLSKAICVFIEKEWIRVSSPNRASTSSVEYVQRAPQTKTELTQNTGCSKCMQKYLSSRQGKRKCSLWQNGFCTISDQNGNYCFWFTRRKKLRFHPRQLYPAAKQGEVQRVLLMLSE